VPPKPNALHRAACGPGGRGCGTSPTKPFSRWGVGRSRLAVGGATLWCRARMVKIWGEGRGEAGWGSWICAGSSTSRGHHQAGEQETKGRGGGRERVKAQACTNQAQACAHPPPRPPPPLPTGGPSPPWWTTQHTCHGSQQPGWPPAPPRPLLKKRKGRGETKLAVSPAQG